LNWFDAWISGALGLQASISVLEFVLSILGLYSLDLN
jgi:hypothetical protein